MCTVGTKGEKLNMDDDDDLCIERLLERNKFNYDEIISYEARELGPENKSKFSWTEINRVVIDIHNNASSDTQYTQTNYKPLE